MGDSGGPSDCGPSGCDASDSGGGGGSDSYMGYVQAGLGFYAPTTRSKYRPPKAPPTKYEALGGASAYQIRLDAPNDGFSYAPDPLQQHNPTRRLFVPYRADGSGRLVDEDLPEYSYVKDMGSDSNAPAGAAWEQGDRDDEVDQLAETAKRYLNVGSATAAQSYAASVDLSPSLDDAGRFPSQSQTLSDVQRRRVEEASRRAAKGPSASQLYTQSLAGGSAISTKTSSGVSAMTLAAEKGEDGFLPAVVRQNAQLAKTTLPASIGGSGEARTYASHRVLARPTEEEKEKGITAVEEMAGEGRPPTVDEAASGASSIKSDGASATTNTTLQGAGPRRRAGISDIFVPDPRPWRPLRFVRRTDPSQMLLVISGTHLSGAESRSRMAAEAALKLGLTKEEAAKDPAKVQALLEKMEHEAREKMRGSFGTSGLGEEQEATRAGLSFVYCPALNPSVAAERDTRMVEEGGRLEKNFERRLEVVPDLMPTSKKRATLRAALAALEYVDWETEGFDKVVIATTERWLVDGISNDIWGWRFNDWQLTIDGPLGMQGELVPDKDLWELLDGCVKRYEQIDISIRFWLLPPSAKTADPIVLQARALAEQGAMRDTHYPSTVKWRRPKRLGFGVLEEEERKRKEREDEMRKRMVLGK